MAPPNKGLIMKKTALLLLIFALGFSTLQAQNNLYKKKRSSITIVGDTAVNQLVKKHIQINERVKTIPGYRIQIASLSGPNAKANAFALKDKFKTDFLGVEVYIVFEEPNFKIKVGDFKSRLEAYAFLQHIKAAYPGNIVREEIYPVQLDWSQMIPESEDDI